MRLSSRPRARRAAVAVVAAAALLTPAACGGEDEGALTWYINPDAGGQEKIAAACSEQSGGSYTIETSILPEDATLQREQLLRRLAGEDSSVDIMSIDPPYIPEFAAAGFLWDIPDGDEQQLVEGVVQGSVDSSTYDDEVVTLPFHINTQLLWYRKSVAEEAGLDTSKPITWQQLIEAAEQTGTTIGVQANRYEGYVVWINALVESAGGQVLENPTAPPADLEVGLDSEAGAQAATVINEIASRGLGGPAMSTADEEAARVLFQGNDGGFLVNWPYVWPTWAGEVEAKTLDQSVVDDFGWTLYPRLSAEQPSAPPVGGINLGIGAFSEEPELAYEAAKCITSEEQQSFYFVDNGSPAALESVYDDKAVQEAFPMADELLASMDQAATRPQTPYYPEVTFTLQETWHPPAAVDPEQTPQEATDLLLGVIRGEELL